MIPGTALGMDAFSDAVRVIASLKTDRGLSMRRPLIYAIFLLAVLGIGLLIGTVTRPDGWYAALAKPPFNPPNWVFGPVWTVLYVMIAIAGARTWESGTGGSDLWLAQMALNFAWTPVFFRLHSAGGGAGDHRRAADRDPRLHRHPLARRSRQRAVVRALRRVGRLRERAQRGNCGAELRHPSPLASSRTQRVNPALIPTVTLVC